MLGDGPDLPSQWPAQPLVLNLGCGYKTSDRCTNIDFSIPVRLKSSRVGRRLAPLILSGERKSAYEAMSGAVMGRDLRKGIPFATGSVDAVYHSHVLEHLDREAVPVFLAEIHRVLRPGGVLRIVVPDLERQARDYVASLDRSLATPGDPAGHEQFVSNLIEQLVRKQAWGTSQRRPARRWLENRILGDARQRGETHQWMWDRYSLPEELRAAGFREAQVMSNASSRIPDWDGYGLDRDADGHEYKPGSLYVEAIT